MFLTYIPHNSLNLSGRVKRLTDSSKPDAVGTRENCNEVTNRIADAQPKDFSHLVFMLVVNTCLTRSATSSLYFDALFATIFAVLDEQSSLGNDGTIHKTIPLHPTWWFYDFRMYSQAALLCYNLVKFIYEAQQNDMMLIMSVIRCFCVFVILARHHYYCRYKWLELTEGLWNVRFTVINALCMIGYNIVGAISSGVDPYFAVDRAAMIVFFAMPMGARVVSVAASKLYSKLTTRTVGQTVVVGTVIPPIIIFDGVLSLFYFLLCIAVPASPWLTDRVLMCCILSFSTLTEVLKVRKRVFATEKLKERTVSVIPPKTARVVPVADDGELGLATDLEPVQEHSVPNSRVTALDSEVGTHVDTDADVGAGVDGQIDGLQEDVENVEKLKQFTDAKRGALWIQVSGTFLVVISAELVLSMTLYSLTGLPTVWCAPFAFQDVNKGFQVVLDYVL